MRLLLLSALTGPAQAHDPGLSTAEVSLTTSAVAVRLVLPRAELPPLLVGGAPIGIEPGSVSPADTEVAAFAAGAVILRDTLNSLVARKAEFHKPTPDEIQLVLEYPRPSGTLRLEFPLLSKLNRGHRLLVSVHGATAGKPARRLLDASADGFPLAGETGTGVRAWLRGLWFATLHGD